MFGGKSLDEFVKLAASDAPVPGGGGIAALVGSLGAAMGSMAGNFTIGRPKYAAVDAEARSIVADLAPLIDALLKGVDADAEAFSAISAAYRLPKTSDAESAARKAAISAALTGAMNAPLAILADCLKAARRLPELAAIGNLNLLSDVEVSAIMLEAAGRAARINVRINAGQLDAAVAAAAMAEADAATAELAELLRITLDAVEKRRT